MPIRNIAKDLPFQFQGKGNIDALCAVFDRQLREVASVFESLRCDRSFDTAVGKQLDRIGDIVGLTRAEGALLCGKDGNNDVFDDDKYRVLLKYKAYRNANNCTCEDVLNQLVTILGEDAFSYSEDMAYPATILLSVNLNNDGDMSLTNIPAVAPAGVKVLYDTKVMAKIAISSEDIEEVARTPAMYCGTFVCGTRPQSVSLGG